jgi:hypothetical protein
MNWDRTTWFNVIYLVGALIVALLQAFGYGNFVPDPGVATLAGLLAVAVPILVNWVARRQLQEEIAARE